MPVNINVLTITRLITLEKLLVGNQLNSLILENEMNCYIRAYIWMCGERRRQDFMCDSLIDAENLFASLTKCVNVESMALYSHTPGTLGEELRKSWEKP